MSESIENEDYLKMTVDTFYTYIVEKTLFSVEESMRELCKVIACSAERGEAYLVLQPGHITSGHRLWLRKSGFNIFTITEEKLVISWEHTNEEDKEKVRNYFTGLIKR